MRGLEEVMEVKRTLGEEWREEEMRAAEQDIVDLVRKARAKAKAETDAERRREAWIQFACAACASSSNTTAIQDAGTADDLLMEYDKRVASGFFNPKEDT